MEIQDGIPRVNFSTYSLDQKDVKDDVIDKLGQQICQAFSEIGFVYILNHGIKENIVNGALEVTGDFFSLDFDVKNRYKRSRVDSLHGYSKLKDETLNPDRPADYKESFNVNVSPKHAPGPKSWPDAEVKDFKTKTLELFQNCEELAKRVLRCMAAGLGLKDKETFACCHDMNNENCSMLLRFLNYPPVPAGTPSGQARCGEHSDYGSITLLFQDDVGGLEVQRRDGVYVAAPPIPGAVIINVGDLMQRWTSDRLISTKHRVLLPNNTQQADKTRRSVAFFVDPNMDTLITCLDGTNKYQPITSEEYIAQRYRETYISNELN